MPIQTRIDQLRDELRDIDDKIRDARKGPNVSLDGHSMSRQQLMTLYEERAIIADALTEALRGGPFGQTVVTGRYDHVGVIRTDQL